MIQNSSFNQNMNGLRPPDIRTFLSLIRNMATGEEPIVERLRREIEATRGLCQYNTTRNKTTAVNTFERFISEAKPHRPITIRNLSADHIKAFECWALRSCKPSTVALHMRCLRSLVNRINGQGIMLFRHVRTGNCQTEKRAVSEETINRLAHLQLRPKSPLAVARDIFLLCFYGMGIPLIDVVFMKKSQIQGGYITYFRKKTHRKVRIRVCPELERIVSTLGNHDSPFLLPILTTDDGERQRRQYQYFYLRYSKELALLSTMLGGGVRLTSYVARHSWASIAYRNNVSINIIAQALGHANTNITYAYIKEIDNQLLDDANLTVLEAVR